MQSFFCAVNYGLSESLQSEFSSQTLVAPERGDVCGTQTEGFRRLYQTLLTKFVQTWLTPLSLRDIFPFRGDKYLWDSVSKTNHNLSV